MSLDVSLIVEGLPILDIVNRIFVRENGQTKEITRAEWDERFPGREPVVMPARIDDSGEVYSANITHNLAKMASEAGIYRHLWRPDEIGIERAEQLIGPLETGLTLLESDPDRFKKLNPENGWGTYEGLIHFVRDYLEACRNYPSATVSVWR
jgi:hypothetical protein